MLNKSENPRRTTNSAAAVRHFHPEDYFTSLQRADGEGLLTFSSRPVGFAGNKPFTDRDKFLHGVTRDQFSHLPDSYDPTYFPPADLTTAIEKLKDPFGSKVVNSAFSGYSNIDYDVSGGTLCEANTRRFSPIGRRLLESFGMRSPVNVLELGAGAGVSAGELSRLSHVTVDTCALTPTSPYLRFNVTHRELSEKVMHGFHADGHEWPKWERELTAMGCDAQALVGMKRLYFMTSEGENRLLRPGKVYAVPTKLALWAHALLAKEEIITATDRPYIRHQYIGAFPGHVAILGKRYQLIHDDKGPIHYETVQRSYFSSSFGVNDLAGAILTSYQWLSENGAICITSSIADDQGSGSSNIRNAKALYRLIANKSTDSYYEVSALLEARRSAHLAEIELPDSSLLILHGSHKANPGFLVLNRFNPLAIEFRSEKGLRPNEGGVFEVDNLPGKLCSDRKEIL